MFEKHNISLQMNKRNKKLLTKKFLKKVSKSFCYVKRLNYICKCKRERIKNIINNIKKKKGKNYGKEEL